MNEWTPGIVLERLIEAYRVIEFVTGRVGPAKEGSSLPPMRLDPEDRYTGKRPDEVELALKEAQERRNTFTAAPISMALEAQRWPIDYLPDEDKRDCLIAYATCKARNDEWSKFVQRRNRRTVHKKAWIRRTTYRWNEQSLQQIAEKLNNDSVLLRLSEHCEVSRISRTRDFVDAAETPSATNWMAPDAKPRGPRELGNPDIHLIPKPKTKNRAKA